MNRRKGPINQSSDEFHGKAMSADNAVPMVTLSFRFPLSGSASLSGFLKLFPSLTPPGAGATLAVTER